MTEPMQPKLDATILTEPVSPLSGRDFRSVRAIPRLDLGNQTKIEQTTVSSEIDERTPRGLSLAPFEVAMRAGA